ncbi:MAG TPA: SEL1-like repeat protein [Gammaproteobacteria bacterium]|nr:SEL1-like repeat protein [Gammaproteobacteria bacterium]
MQEDNIYIIEKLIDVDPSRAAYLLGRSYQVGLGIDKNLEQAKKWLTLARNQGFYSAKSALLFLKIQNRTLLTTLKRSINKVFSRLSIGSIFFDRKEAVCSTEISQDNLQALLKSEVIKIHDKRINNLKIEQENDAESMFLGIK